MEDTLGDDTCSMLDIVEIVLILVLMEDTLGVRAYEHIDEYEPS